MEIVRKKILYLSPNGYLGGAERFILDACKGHLVGKKFFPVILFFNRGQLGKMAADLGIEGQYLPFKVRLRNPFSVVRALIYIRRLIKKQRFEIVHATMPYSHIFSSLALIGKKKVKRVWFQHGPVGGMLDFVASFFPVDRIFFNSDFLRSEHLKSISKKLVLDKTSIIPLGVNREEQTLNLAKNYLDYEEQLLVGMVGRITYWKGFHTLVAALEYLRKTNEELFKRAKYLIVGDAKTSKDKKYEEKLHQLVVEKNLATSIYFLGYRPDVANVYGALDILVHASTIPEPFGYVVAEAMLYNTVVIGSSEGGVQDILRERETGLTYNSTVFDAHVLLAKKLSLALTSYDEFKVVRNNARSLIEARHSFTNMNKTLESIYEELI